MRKRKLRVIVVAMVAGLSAQLGVVGMTATQASASIPTNFTTGIPAPYVATSNASDPDVEPCTYNGQTGYCLYASHDRNEAPIDCDSNGNNCQNYYPMTETLGYFSTDGRSWTAEGNRNNVTAGIFNESAYVSKGWTPSGAKHLWAPNVENVGGTYYLLDPDVSSLADEHTSSFIGVSTSSSPFGPFTPQSRISGDPSVHGGYASDPDLVKGGDGREYLVYANGDVSNCGGLSIGYVNSPNFTGFHTGWPQTLTINGVGVLGNCGGTGHPYMEGPSLYYTPNWEMAHVPGPYLLEFAAKPDSTPAGCNGHGEPSTSNSVIAYATANSPGGPYTYQGILMCGSSTEWTDQASIIPMADQYGAKELVLVYHDGPAPSTGRNRTVHAEALMYGGGKLAGALRSGGSSYSQGGAYQNLLARDTGVFALMSEDSSPVPDQVVTTNLSAGAVLSAGRIAVGPWEGFSLPIPYIGEYDIDTLIDNSTHLSGAFLESNANSEMVSVYSSSSNLVADSYDFYNPEQFDFFFWGGDGTVTIFGSDDLSVATQSDGTLKANGVPEGYPAEHYYVLHY